MPLPTPTPLLVGGSPSTGSPTRFRPGRTLVVDLDGVLPRLDPARSDGGVTYGFALVLVRLEGTPLGTVRIDLRSGPCEADDLATVIERELADAIDAHLTLDPSSRDRAVSPAVLTAAATTPVSVIIPTCRRFDLIGPCIDSVLENDHDAFEVLVVDNGPDDPRTKAVIDERFGDDPRVRYLAEARPGASQARNAGLRAARHEIVVFTDDDVITDPSWITNITAPFLQDRRVACVTGLTQPLELETEAQIWFEQYGGFSGGFARRRLALDMSDPPTLLFPFTSTAGASNNMAMRRETAVALGGFDVRLGPGSIGLGGEDLDMFTRVLLDGLTIAYEPRALLWHTHRRTESELLKHVYAYGAGSVAMLSKWFEHDPAMRAKALRHLLRLPAAFGPRDRFEREATRPPARIKRAQVRGGLSGPTRWIRARAAAPDAPAPVPRAVDAHDVTAVVCTYTEERWELMVDAVRSLLDQSPPPREVLVVVDHAPALYERVRRELPEVRALENEDLQGLSGGRNTALRAASTPLVAFLDDDAVAGPGWIGRLATHFVDQHVLGAGGRVQPRWQERRPSWFPREFDWVLGCTYQGVPERLSEVRNPFGGAMIIRRDEALAAGGYRTDLGRIGAHPAGCEETELCIRLRRADRAGRFLYDPDAEIHHFAPTARCTWPYFRRRCFAEGRSKAVVRRLAGPADGLSTERSYVLGALPRGVALALLDTARGRWSGFARAGAIVAGLGWTATGFALETAIGWLRPDRYRGADQDGEDHPQNQRRGGRQTEGEEPGGERAGGGRAGGGRAGGDDFRPIWVGAVDIDAPFVDLVAPSSPSGGPHYERALVVPMLHGQPVGVLPVDLHDGRLAADELCDRVLTGFDDEIVAHLAADGRSDARSCWIAVDEHVRLPFVSVVLCTRDRAAEAELAIEQILALDYPCFELVVVDNAPTHPATQDLVVAFARKDPRVRYVREPVPGLASARNRGISAARGDLVAFTDDDIRVPAWWLRALAHGFDRAPDVVCVTGAVMAGSFDTRAEALFDQAVASGAKWGFVPRLFDPTEPPDSPLFPYQVGVYGGGGNSAFARDYLIGAGGFDPALGAGTATRGGEDLDAFVRVMADGRCLAYEPAALVWHLHRTDDREVRAQAFHYGVGLGAFLFKIACDPTHAWPLLTRVPRALRYLISASSAKNAQKDADFPRSLTALELLGIAWGPVAYLRSRRQVAGRGTGAMANHDPGDPRLQIDVDQSDVDQNGGLSYTRT